MLALVCVLLFAAGLIVMAFQTLSRTTSRTLYSVQEHRQLVNLCRSAVSEAVYKIQARLEQGDGVWIGWCTSPSDVRPRDHDPTYSRQYTSGITNDPSFLEYKLEKVALRRIQGVPRMPGMSGQVGAIDFVVQASVRRTAPAHSAKLIYTERHGFWFSDAPTPFASEGRHIEILPTPAATFMEIPE